MGGRESSASLRSTVKPFASDLARGTGRRRCRAYLLPVFLAAVGVALAPPTATRAESASAPDSAHIALVRFALLDFEDVRVVTGNTKLAAHHAVVSPDGLQLHVDLGTSITSSRRCASFLGQRSDRLTSGRVPAAPDP